MGDGILILFVGFVSAVAAFLLFVLIAVLDGRNRWPWRDPAIVFALSCTAYLVTFPWGEEFETANSVRGVAMILATAAVGGLIGGGIAFMLKRLVRSL
ncbi:hypothetical protein [Sphingomonas sp.]|uniref:hypothetical protein n=1 Tax=Sphingomonas sp. TaxID=28214 RepID=UPI003B3B9973